jgi:hypothetical protein
MKARRALEYVYGCPDHCIHLRPKSLNIVASADASYAEHVDARSHTGGCVGFEGYDGNHSYFIFVSSKQPIVSKSSCEAELISANTIADYVVWLKDLMLCLELDTGIPAEFQQDNKATIRISAQGKGTFKRTKHIKVRYFWLKDLIDVGVLVMSYVPTAEMVSDLLTKPLIGSKFRYLLSKMLGWNAVPEE